MAIAFDYRIMKVPARRPEKERKAVCRDFFAKQIFQLLNFLEVSEALVYVKKVQKIDISRLVVVASIPLARCSSVSLMEPIGPRKESVHRSVR